MAVRIYALAKEFKIDSLDLVDVCAKVGIKGKGSALASLSDDEVTKLRDHFANPTSPSGGAKANGPVAPASSAAPVRPSQSTRSGKMQVISTSRPQPPLAGMAKSRDLGGSEAVPAQDDLVEEQSPVEEQPTEEQPVTPPAAEETPSAAEASVAEPPATETPVARSKSVASPPSAAGSKGTVAPRSPGPLAGRMRREEYVGPGNATGKMKTIGGQGQGGNKGGVRSTGNASRRPAIKLAPIPAADQPTPTGPVKSKDEPVQKPDMRLPADALKAGKSGAKPLAAHLRRHEQTHEAAKRQGTKTGTAAETTDDSRKGRRGAKGKEAGKEGTSMLGGREQRQLTRQRQGARRGGNMRPRRHFRRSRKSGINTAAPRKDKVELQLPCTVREFSEAAGVPAIQILRFLMDEGVMTTIAAVMDPELTEMVAAELDVDIVLKEAVSIEDKLLSDIIDQVDAEEDLVSRPPVITFLGHVDHGKTSLLDRLIGIDVVSGESGGITQHIRAYSIEKEGKQISFVDTPGHEAFTEMRARGANVTDIAVLVVAADDGVMPQTEEAISHGRAAEVPIVVALNKTDLPDVNIDRAMQGLSTNNLLPSEWGGDVEVIKTSATTGAGLDDLLDTLLTVAELHEYQANPKRAALGTCLEAQQETGRGIVAKVIVQNGTLRVGDIVVCGTSYGKVKAMYDTLHPRKKLKEAGPSIPVNITGFNEAPGAGEHFYVLDSIADARTVAESRAENERDTNLGAGIQHVTLENLFDRLEGEGDTQTLNLILRADVRGSIEAIQKELEKLDHPEVKLKLLQASVGGITEADITLADASDAIVLGFNVVPDEKARLLADKRGVQVKRYEVIYKITDDLKAALEGMLIPEEREVELGRALVQQTFKISRIGTIAGCRVLSGTVHRNARARVIRDSTIIGDYPVDTLRREKDDAKEVREGFECGMKLSGFNDVKEGDIFEVYKVEEIGRSFDESNI